MSDAQHDRNLLFGILALQMDFISRDALVTAMNAWVLEKSRPLGEILVQQNALSRTNHDLLAPLVDAHIRQHANDPQQSLAAIGSLSSAVGDLRSIADADVQATLDHLSSVRWESGGEPTETYSVGAATSAGTRFRILRPHAEGALGKVSVARDEELSREVALKEIKLVRAHDPNSRARFLLEAEVTGGLEHPNIIPVYGLGQYADGRPFYVMRFVRGDNLKDAVARYHGNVAGTRRVPNADGTQRVPVTSSAQQSLEFRKLLRRFIDVCNAIEYAHHRGVLHRDLKPGNIMLGKYGETLVVDWGLSKVMSRPESPEASALPLDPSSGSGSAETQMGTAVGTPAFMSPEQAARRHKVATASASALLIAAVIALTVGTVLLGREQARTDRARQDEKRAKDEALENLRMATTASAQATAAEKATARQLAFSYIARTLILSVPVPPASGGRNGDGKAA